MTIGIVTGFSLKHSAGLEQFLIGLLEGLEFARPEGVEYIIYTSKSSDIEEVLIEHALTSFRVVRLGFGSFWKQFGLFFAPRADAYLFNGPMVPIFFAPQHSFVLDYDFAYKLSLRPSFRERMHNFMIDTLSAIAFRRAEKIIAISEATKKDVIRFFGVATEKCVVIYPGVKDLSVVKNKKVMTPLNGYFLFVGTVKERKNLLNLVRGFIVAVKESGVTYDLLIAGRNNLNSTYGHKITKTISMSGISSRIHFLGNVSEGELAYLYTNAIALTFPSVFEGFGMPVVEAMLLDVPVLTSNVSSLPEAAGDAALLVNPYEPDTIAKGLARLANDERLREDMARKGKLHATKFSWTISAKQLLKVICINP